MISERTIVYLIILFLILAGISLSGNTDYTPPPRTVRTTSDPAYQQEWRESVERSLERGANLQNRPLPGGGTVGDLSSIAPDK